MGLTPPTEFISRLVLTISTAGFAAAKHGMDSDRHNAAVNRRARIFFFTVIPPIFVIVCKMKRIDITKLSPFCASVKLKVTS